MLERLLDHLALGLAALLIYGLLPAYALRGISSARAWALGFLSVSLLFSTTIPLLGYFGLAQPGALFLLYAAAFTALYLYRRPLWLSHLRERCIALLESRRALQLPKLHLLFPTLLAIPYLAELLASARFSSLFSEIQANQSIILGHLRWGQPHPAWDPAATLLLPLSYLTGASEVRTMQSLQPLAALALTAALAYLVYASSRSLLAVRWSLALFFLLRASTNSSASDLSAAFLLLGLTFLRQAHYTYALLAALLGALTATDPTLWPPLILPLLCASLTLLCKSWLSRVPVPAILLLTTSALAFAPLWRPAIASAYQSEAAAQATESLLHQGQRNRWLLVSSQSHLPFVYGQAWHMSIAEFARRFPAASLERKEFRFNLPVDKIYFILEHSPSSAESDHLRLAHLLEAYARTHTNLELLSDQDNIKLFQLGTTPPPPLPATSPHPASAAPQTSAHIPD